MCKKFFLLGGMLFVLGFVHAQHPFQFEINHFKKEDSLHFPPKHAILFLGSSSFRKWEDAQKYFPGYTIINRGFGGSTIPDATYYADEIVFPYEPKQIVIYEGDNDVASSSAITADSVLNRFEKLFYTIRRRLPETYIAYVSIKPSPSRQKLMPEMARANTLIKNFLKGKKRTAFIDVYHKMLTADGQPDKSLFLSDNLHMNEKGYEIWQKAIQPYLIK